MKKIVTVNSRGQVSLGKYADCSNYAIEIDGEGRIILTPVEIIPVSRLPKFVKKEQS